MAAKNKTGAGDDLSNGRLIADLRLLGRAALVSPERRELGLLLLGIVVVVSGVAYMQIRLNAWNAPFYDALANHNFQIFLRELGVFGVIAGLLLALTVAQTWLVEMLKLTLRKQATRDLLDQWLAPGRAFRISRVGEIGINPDQRMHEDARHLTELSAELGVGLFQASLLLLAFVGVLWGLSENVTFTIRGVEWAVPGYMVWCAIFYAGTASWLSWRIGGSLISLNSERYGREADLRIAMVRVSQHADTIALYGGENEERRRLDAPLGGVIVAMRRLVTALARLTWITSGYGWFTLVAPIIVAAPAYFSGKMSFGVLMMAVGAFNQVQQALRWFVDNFARIADWRATLLRVVTFRQALLATDQRVADATARIVVEASPDETLVMSQLEVGAGDHWARLSEPDVEVRAGEHLLIVGEPGVGKSTLFRAIAGLWECGCGTLRMPKRSEMLFLPQNPYLPPGTLREALQYPHRGANFDPVGVTKAFERTHLRHLSSDLDRFANWDNELTMDEKQRFAITRALLQRPRWVIIDEALEAIEERHRRMVLSIFQSELRGTAVINLSAQRSTSNFYGRRIDLLRMPVPVGEPRAVGPGCSVRPGGEAMRPPATPSSRLKV